MIKYIINEEKKVVVAKFEKDYKGAKDKYVWKKLIAAHIDNVLRIIDNVLDETSSFYSVAKCAPGDTFDVKKGKELAKKRLLKKYYRAQKKIVQYYVNRIACMQKEFINDLNVTNAKTAIFDKEIEDMKG